jgi:NAD+ diphosphatase
VQEKHVHYVVADEKLLCTEKGEVAVLSHTEIAGLKLQANIKHALKSQRDHEDFVIQVEFKEIPGFQWCTLRSLAESVSEEEFQTAGRALQVLRWHYDHQYCGRCGKPTEQHERDFAKVCKVCGIDFYPRLSPCIITLITRGDECLLAWHTRSSEEKYSCLAGFIEMGESAEKTLAREVKEEVGIEVTNIRYLTSQAWPFPGQLMLGYFADYASGDIVEDKTEIVVARWYRYDQLPKIPPASTISGRLIRTFVQERQSIHTNNES